MVQNEQNTNNYRSPKKAIVFLRRKYGKISAQLPTLIIHSFCDSNSTRLYESDACIIDAGSCGEISPKIYSLWNMCRLMLSRQRNFNVDILTTATPLPNPHPFTDRWFHSTVQEFWSHENIFCCYTDHVMPNCLLSLYSVFNFICNFFFFCKPQSCKNVIA